MRLGRIQGFLILVVWFGLSQTASAHGLSAEAKLIGKTVYVTAYFDDDSPAAEAEVTILDSQQKVLRISKTDRDGKCEFEVPAVERCRIIVDAGGGHLARMWLNIPPETDEAIRDLTPGRSRDDFAGSGRIYRAGLGLAFLLAVYLLYKRFGTSARNKKSPVDGGSSNRA